MERRTGSNGRTPFDRSASLNVGAALRTVRQLGPEQAAGNPPSTRKAKAGLLTAPKPLMEEQPA